MNLGRRFLRRLAVWSPRFESLYRRFCRPSGREWAEMRRERGDFHSMGDFCAVNPHAIIEGAKLVRFGNNVRLASCYVFTSDASVNMINRAYGLHLDLIGKVEFRDNVFIGFGAIILPGVTIGPNAVVSAGSVVRADVAEGDIVSGIPARRVGRLDMTVAMMKAKNETYPWKHLIEKRGAEFDAAMEPELMKLRVRHFYGSDEAK
jgi:acetyltransferase-like isoleucine patch superfamily enzyme